MPDGFHVKLESIELFKQTANDTLQEYRGLAQTLPEGNIRAKNPSFEDLLGFAIFDGSNRVHDASHEMSDIDDKHAAVFQRFLDEHPGDSSGGSHGTP